MSQVIRAAGDDAVTLARRELKFALPGVDAAAIIETLSTNLKPVAFGSEPDSRVSSIYFDDDQLISFRESMDGVSRRTNLRLRWYDGPPEDITELWFELKHRRNVSISKERFPIQLERPLSAYRYVDLHRHVMASLASETAEEWLMRRPSPTVLVSYRRRHFRDLATGIRLTVDREICGYDQLGFSMPGLRFATPLEDLTVIEVKTPVGEEARAAELLYPLKPRLTRSSKYASCCSRMGWQILAEPHD
ncbi:MAG: polyphosphate polymerase domain-containing protein [Verrucomicrobiales bacterium]